MRIASLVLGILLTFTFSCGPVLWEGNKVDATKRDQIVKNKTTAAEVEALFGKPYKVEKMGAGKEKYIYYYQYEEYVAWYTLPRTMLQRMEVMIANGVVTDYEYFVESRDPLPEYAK